MPQNSLKFAQIQAESGIRGTFYFRSVKASWDESIIREIAALGHEIGYHYEDLNIVASIMKKGRKLDALTDRSSDPKSKDYLKLEKELAGIAIQNFQRNLEKLRRIVPVKTICMHGSPLSRWDSRILWKYYDYKDYGLIGEPYFDIDYSKVLYLTDTGRRWDGDASNIRDKVRGKSYEFKLHSTYEIIKALDEKILPDSILLNFHPQRWTDNSVKWLEELIVQNLKNVVKYGLKHIRK